MSLDAPGPATAAGPERRWTPAELAGRLRDIYETKDLEGFRDLLTPEAVLHSPFLQRYAFVGREEVCLSMWASFALTDHLAVAEELVGKDTAGLHFHYTGEGKPASGVILFHLDEHGRVDEINAMIQSLEGLVRFGRAFAERAVVPRHKADYAFVAVPTSMVLYCGQLLDSVASWFFARRIPANADRAMTLPRPFRPFRSR